MRIEVPIAIGLIAIAAESSYQTFMGSHATYWDSLAGLVFFLLCGEGFKQRTLNHLSFDQDYRAFFPLSVLRYHGDRIESVSISEIKTGDRLRIRNKELFPADGRLVRGTARVDYSFVTGEADPITVSAGSSVRAGGRNLGSAVEVETSKTISESYLTSLWSHQIFKKPTSKTVVSLTDHVSRYFTPVVLSIACSGALYWAFHDAAHAIPVFVSVLIVACPCALALAAPFATGTALRLLSRKSIHLKSASVIERLSAINTLVFDKTGTLTQSNCRSIHFLGPPLNELEQRLLSQVSLHSAHPFSVSIHNLCPTSLESAGANDFEEFEGRGVRATVDGVRLVYGSREWLLYNGVEIPKQSEKLESEIHLAINNQYRGRFIVRPDLRPEIPRTIDRLRPSYDLRVASGDSNRDQDSLRALFGKKAEMSFSQSPYSKLRVIEELQEQGKQVMFIGDGLNDAGALMQANVGVALTEDSAHFCPASDIILDAPLLPELPTVLRFSKAVVKVISACFILSFAYNIAGIGLAATGRLSPLIAAILMPLSSITIVAFSVAGTSWVASRLGITEPASISASTR